MKKKLLSILGALLLPLAVFAQNTVTINGTMPALPDGTEVLVSNYAVYDRSVSSEILAKCPIKNGKFTMQFEINEPRQVVVWVERPHSNKPIVVMPGDQVSINADKPHGLFQADVEGAKTDEAFNKIYEKPYRKDRPQDISQTDYMKQLIKENKNSFFGPLLVYAWSGHSLGYEEFYNLFPKQVQESFHGQALKVMVENERAEKAKANDPAQKAKANALKRQTPAYDKPENVIDAIVAQYPGKVVFIDFWATWCGPCRNAMKTIQPLEPWMAENDIVRVYVSAPSSDATKWELMITDIGGNHYFLNDEEWKAIGNRYGFGGIPYYHIYNKQGECTFSHTGYPGNDRMKEEFQKALSPSLVSDSSPFVTIRGTVEGMDGKTVSLFYSGMPERNRPVEEGTATITNGAYEMVIPATETMIYHIECPRFTAQFVASPGDEIVFSGHTLLKANVLQEQLKLATDAMWSAYNEGRVKAYQQHKAILDEVNDNPDKEFSLKSSPDYIAYTDEIAQWEIEHGKAVRKLMHENRDNIFGIACFAYHAGFMDPTQDMYDELSDEVKQSAYGQAMKTAVENSWVGRVMADFTLPDADGNMHSMKELLKGHDYLMIDFWASWCKPCRRGLPFMKDYAKKYEKDNLAMLNVSIDKKREDWIKANNDENLPWTSLWDNNEVAKSFGVRAIPSVWLLDKNGNVIFAQKWGDSIGMALRKVFGH